MVDRITLNPDLASIPLPKQYVVDAGGSRVGTVDAQSQQLFLQTLSSCTNTYFNKQIIGPPTTTSTTQMLFHHVFTGGIFMARGEFELFVQSTTNFMEHYRFQYSAACNRSSNLADGLSITMTNATSTATTLVKPPLVSSVVLAVNHPAFPGSPLWAEVRIVFASAVNAGPAIGVNYFWAPSPANAAQDSPPQTGWGAITAGSTNSITLNTNDGTHCYTFACISNNSSAQTNFL